MTTHADLDEFSFLADDARDQSAAVPDAERVQLTLPDGRTLRAIRFGSGDPRTVFLRGATTPTTPPRRSRPTSSARSRSGPTRP